MQISQPQSKPLCGNCLKADWSLILHKHTATKKTHTNPFSATKGKGGTKGLQPFSHLSNTNGIGKQVFLQIALKHSLVVIAIATGFSHIAIATGFSCITIATSFSRIAIATSFSRQRTPYLFPPQYCSQWRWDKDMRTKYDFVELVKRKLAKRTISWWPEADSDVIPTWKSTRAERQCLIGSGLQLMT